MSRTILTLALASSVSALLPAKAPVSVRGVYSAPLASSSALLSMRSRPPYMSIDPDTHAKIAAAGYSSGFSDGLKAAAMVGAPTEAEARLLSPESRAILACKGGLLAAGVDGPLLQTLATVCGILDDAGAHSKQHPFSKRDPLKAKYVPAVVINGATVEPNNNLDQA